MFSANVCSAARDHARAEFPKESCGLVVSGNYVPCRNVNTDPEHEFKIDDHVWTRWRANNKVQALVHSHPNGLFSPSFADLEAQMAMPDIPWGVIQLDQFRIQGPFFWGDTVPIAPLEGRAWKMGVHDCYGLVRDYYNLKFGIVLNNYPRKNEWWLDKMEQSLLVKMHDEVGFHIVKGGLAEIREHDVLLVKFAEMQQPTHLGIYIGNNLVLHHRWDRPSCRLPIGPYMHMVDRVLRYEKCIT